MRRKVVHPATPWVLLLILVFGLTTPTPAPAADKKVDVDALLAERDPERMINALNEKMREQVRDTWQLEIEADAELAAEQNVNMLYPNPILQAYVNQLGQGLIPHNASRNSLMSFKILEDAIPRAFSLNTGTVFLSTGVLSMLDNESQLVFILAHEASHVLAQHHLLQIIEIEKGEKKARRNKMLGAIAGAVAGAAIGGNSSDYSSANLAMAGAGLGVVSGGQFGRFRAKKFDEKIQKESDAMATEMVLRARFDAREAPILMAKMADVAGRSDVSVGLSAFGDRKNLELRKTSIAGLLNGPYRGEISRALEGEGFHHTSPRFNQLMAELKRDNGFLALRQDLFAIAQANFEEAAEIRTDDPVNLYGLGLLYRAIARTPEERRKAISYFQSAMKFDAGRNRFPAAQREYAVELISQENPQHYPEIQRALKNYVVLFQRLNGGRLPRDIRFVYDYLELTGDKEWMALPVNNVSTLPPYQLTGVERMDTAPWMVPASSRP